MRMETDEHRGEVAAPCGVLFAALDAPCQVALSGASGAERDNDPHWGARDNARDQRLQASEAASQRSSLPFSPTTNSQPPSPSATSKADLFSPPARTASPNTQPPHQTHNGPNTTKTHPHTSPQLLCNRNTSRTPFLAPSSARLAIAIHSSPPPPPAAPAQLVSPRLSLRPPGDAG